jgi:hypothetical protein
MSHSVYDDVIIDESYAVWLISTILQNLCIINYLLLISWSRDSWSILVTWLVITIMTSHLMTHNSSRDVPVSSLIGLVLLTNPNWPHLTSAWPDLTIMTSFDPCSWTRTHWWLIARNYDSLLATMTHPTLNSALLHTSSSIYRPGWRHQVLNNDVIDPVSIPLSPLSPPLSPSR